MSGFVRGELTHAEYKITEVGVFRLQLQTVVKVDLYLIKLALMLNRTSIKGQFSLFWYQPPHTRTEINWKD